MPAEIDVTRERARTLSALGVDLVEILTSIRDQILILDREQRTVAILGEWPHSCAWRPADLIGKTFREVFGDSWADVHEAANARALQGEQVASEWSVDGPPPARFSTTVSPLRDASLTIVGLVIVTRNITAWTMEEKRLEASIAHKTQQLFDLEHSVRRLAEAIKTYRLRDVPGESANARTDVNPLRRLSPRERQVLDLLGQGYRARSIAKALKVSPETVRNHLKAMFKKTGTHSQAELTALLRNEAGDG